MVVNDGYSNGELIFLYSTLDLPRGQLSKYPIDCKEAFRSTVPAMKRVFRTHLVDRACDVTMSERRQSKKSC